MNPPENLVRLREAAFDAVPLAQIVVDPNGLLVLANERACSLFALTASDLGCPLPALEISNRLIELRSLLGQVYRDRDSIHLHDIEWVSPQGEPSYLDVQVLPLLALDNQLLGASATFIDVTPYKRLQEDLEHANQALEMAYEELQSTNEELLSTNEELATTNEELLSTNEELETMNEELQSMNDELQAVNDELQQCSEECNQSNAFLESILTSLKGGVVVVDRNLSVQIWNHQSYDLWGLHREEALGQNFLNLDIGLPVEQLRQPIRACLMGAPSACSEVTLRALNRRGRSFHCRVTCTPLMGAQGQVQGVILLMEEQSEER